MTRPMPGIPRRVRPATLLLSLFLLPAAFASAQTFTRITSGPMVDDGAASRAVCWVDVNHDGALDLFVTNGPPAGQDNMLFTNTGYPVHDFTAVAGDPIVTDPGRFDGASWGDVENDGDLDCFIVNWYGDNDHFFMNDGDGTFTQVTTGPPVTTPGYSETCSWGDYDNDGLIDLYVTNSGIGTGDPNFLYHNDGAGNFTRITTGPEVQDAFISRGANWVDYDADGDLDLFVANEDNQPNNLYRNMLAETASPDFVKITAGAIVTDANASWSGSWADYDNDGDLDLFVANFLNQNNALYSNNGDGTFTKITTGPVVNDHGYSASSAWGDFDNDGDQDLLVTNAFGTTKKKNFLYENQLIETGTADFLKVTTGDLVNELGHFYGCAWGDYDADGDLDIYIAKTFSDSENNALFRNEEAGGNHWVEILCEGSVSNRAGIGAVVYCVATIGGGPVRQMDQIAGQSGYCGQRLTAHFGLGDAAVIDTLRIGWPSGTVDILTNVAANRSITVREGGEIVGVERPAASAPHALVRVSPNPFHSSAVLRYTLAAPGPVSLGLFDASGRLVADLVKEDQAAGEHAVTLEGETMPASGVLFFRLLTRDAQRTGKLLRLR